MQNNGFGKSPARNPASGPGFHGRPEADSEQKQQGARGDQQTARNDLQADGLMQKDHRQYHARGTLSLSTGATLETSPSCMALK